jgi:hypothetical protein
LDLLDLFQEFQNPPWQPLLAIAISGDFLEQIAPRGPKEK